MFLNREQAAKIIKEKQRYFFNGNEKKFEEHVITILDELFENMILPKVKEIQRQKRFTYNDFAIAPDLIIIHEDYTITIIELKCTDKNKHSYANNQVKAIGQ